ncbi:bifunctional 3'-5' exonuclease/DNA polymerase [Kineosporia sp. A_224]|uniref:bifunctional 3'-5' exonuclease/DNA polymerase n=1 Tax=Kineosporia sp. A_224 TaxID=1962180 RepID=UPI0018EA083A|nr:bifunctional 3'-5' exonuclease/DNA polymerase [Kineosporia sp. A_224]
MRICVVTGPAPGSARLAPVDDAGAPAGPRRDVPGPDGLAAVVREAPPDVRWVWADAPQTYPAVLAAGARVERCHDVALTEALLLGAEGRWGEPRSLAAAWARLTGGPVPPDPEPPLPAALGPGGDPDGGVQDALFDAVDVPSAPAALPQGTDPLDVLVAVHADQQRRVAAARAVSPGFTLLVAAESASALAAAEMSAAGLPWRADLHDAVLVEALGPRAAHGGRPPRLQALAEEVARLLGDPRLNPDSPPDVLRALRRAGVLVSSTRRHELRGVDHPAVGPLLQYKELSRLHTANGWAWREQWVRDGRFRPEYVPGGVVSGRWASRGGGALQIPRAVRGAVVADAGRVLVVADAGQLEPRVLAALSADPGMVAATQAGDLYAEIATRALGRTDARAEAKIALLSAMYGGGAGSAAPALAALRRRFPAALELLEEAARTGEDGGSVRSVLGRTSPAAAPGWLDGLGPEAAGGRSRARGRFTRNFVVQASAADWAGVLVAGLRTRLAVLGDRPGDARLVFFQHDEVVLEVREDLAAASVAAVTDAGNEATRLVLPGTGVRVPLEAAVVRSYAEKG